MGASVTGYRYGTRADGTCTTLNQDGPISHGSGNVHGLKGGEARDTEAGTCFVARRLRQGRDVGRRYHRVFRGSAEGPVALGTETPHSIPFGARGNASPDSVDDTTAVTVGDHPREGHADAECVAPLLDVSGIDPGRAYGDPDFALARHRGRQFAQFEDLSRGALPVVPSRFQELSSGTMDVVLQI
jgi:hypothetical protein